MSRQKAGEAALQLFGDFCFTFVREQSANQVSIATGGGTLNIDASDPQAHFDPICESSLLQNEDK